MKLGEGMCDSLKRQKNEVENQMKIRNILANNVCQIRYVGVIAIRLVVRVYP